VLPFIHDPLGGDEFVVVLTGLDASEDATVIARKILQSLTLPVQLDGRTVFTSTSIGISLFPDDGRIAEILISNADLARYLAKEQGRNTYRYFSRSLNERAQLRMRQETDLRLALERQELVLYFQDQVTLDSGRLCGVEALLRWRHPEKGLLLPAEFLPLAEETGLILPIGEWVLRTACRRAQAWQEQGLPPVRIAVNLSRRQLADPGLCTMVKTILEETGLHSAWLELEVTENVFQLDFEQAAQALEALHALGVGIAIDDFGTGFSSLKALRRLPLARLKVDHSFISDLLRDGQNPAMVRTIIAIAHNMGLKVIAEGVKTEQQRGYLVEYGCDEIQGFYLNPPDPEGDWLRLLRTGQAQVR
jgi:predicted signal transduction protein with EAL and GGDEF domain